MNVFQQTLYSTSKPTVQVIYMKKANNVIIPEQNRTSSATTKLNVSMYRINIFMLKCPLGIGINMSNDARGKLLRKTVVQSISVFS